MSEGLQKLENRKNAFYRDRYRYVLRWLVRMLFITLILSGTLFWMTIRTKQPAYYAAVTTGEVIPIHSLSEPVITDDFIVRWAALTSRRLFNLTFVDYLKQLKEVHGRFSTGGWAKMQAALKSSGIINSVVNNKLIMNSVVSGDPVILARMIVHGRFTWRVQLRLLVKFTSASQNVQEHMIVTMDIQRIPTLDSAQGIQITNFVATPAE